jgi:hypothetical protein
LQFIARQMKLPAMQAPYAGNLWLNFELMGANVFIYQYTTTMYGGANERLFSESGQAKLLFMLMVGRFLFCYD